MSDQNQLDRLRQLDVDVDALLDAAVALAEIRRDVRTKATETPLPPGHPDNLSRVLFVPNVEEGDADPCELLARAVEMVKADQRPSLALEVARDTHIGGGGPLENVKRKPRQLFAPEIAQHVFALLSIARRPGHPTWIEGRYGPVPLLDERFLPLPSALQGETSEVARCFLESFRDPALVTEEILVDRMAQVELQRPAPLQPPQPPQRPAPPQPVDPEDLPLDQLPPRPETEAEAAARQADEQAAQAAEQAAEEAAEARRQAEAARQEAAWRSRWLARADETILILRHAAQRAVEQLLQAAGQRPTDVLNPFTMSLVAEALASLPEGERVQLLADNLRLNPKTIRRKLKVYERTYALMRRKAGARRNGHSSTVQCPRKSTNARPILSSVSAGSAERSARKKEPTDADDHHPETQPPPPKVRGVSVRLPAGRPSATQRDQRQPVALDDRPRRGQSHPARKNGPGPEK